MQMAAPTSSQTTGDPHASATNKAAPAKANPTLMTET